MKTKKINALVYGSQLKKLAEKIIKTMEDQNNYNNFGIRKIDDNSFKFKTSYSEATICYEYIYDLYWNINDIFEINESESFAKRCKLVKDYLDKYIEDLTNLSFIKKLNILIINCNISFIKVKFKQIKYLNKG